MPEKLRVLHLVTGLGFGGGGRNMAAFFKFSNRRFFDLILGGFLNIDSRRVEMFTKQGIRVELFHGDYNQLTDFMKREDIDILHLTRAGNEGSELIKASLVARVPLRTELNIFGLYDSKLETRLIDRHFLQSKTTALRYMANTGLSLDALLANCRVQYLPVDIDFFDRLTPSEDRKNQIRQNLDIDPHTPIICRVGRPDLWKWSLFALYSFSLVVERFPTVRFVIIGGAPPLVVSKVRKLGLEKYFRILKEVPDDEATEIVHTADLMAHSSHIGESFGGAIAEAMAARKPVVVNSTDWADNSQIELVDHGTTGVVANTPRQYADAIIYLLRHREVARRMGEMAYVKARAQYSAPEVTSSLEKSYAEISDIKRIKPDEERTVHYGTVQHTPPKEEMVSWSYEYRQRLVKSGYNLGKLGRFFVKSAWMATNISTPLRFTTLPKFLFERNSVVSYLAAVT